MTIAILATIAPGFAQPLSATFECPGAQPDTCFFAIFGSGFSARMFELRGGQSSQVQATSAGIRTASD
jgi:hypothetical protein